MIQNHTVLHNRTLADPDADPKTLTGTIKVTVTEKKTKASVQLSPSSITLAAGRTQQLSVTVRGEDGKTSNDAGLVRFQSADEKIASDHRPIKAVIKL